MEADEEEIELCAEILENWNTPTPTPIYSENKEQPNTKRDKGMEIIGVLVADTFYDKVLGHATDGIDIPALLEPKQIHTSTAQCRRFSATKTDFSFCTQRDFVRKLGIMLFSNKTINTDDFGEKMWRNPGADATDFFNYGLDEEQWRDYCKEMHALIHGPSPGPTITSTHSIEDGEICEVISYCTNKQYLSCRMINGNKMSPYPIDS